jgi:hypothetical protein
MAAKWPLDKSFKFHTPINFPRRLNRVYNRKRFTEQIGQHIQIFKGKLDA